MTAVVVPGHPVPAPRSAVRGTAAPVRAARRPATPAGRWGVRCLLAVPVVGLLAYLHVAATTGLADVLAPDGAGQPWPWVTRVAAAVAAGAAVHSLGERLVRRAVPAWLVVLLVLTVAVTAATALDLLGSPEVVLALGLLVVAVDGGLRFAGTGDTHGGFVAGLLLAAAFVAHPPLLPLLVLLGLLAPSVVPGRHRGERHARTATALVLLFPVAAVAVSWTFLHWQFGSGPALVPALTDGAVTAGQGVVLLVLAGATAVPESPSRRLQVLVTVVCLALLVAVAGPAVTALAPAA